MSEKLSIFINERKKDKCTVLWNEDNTIAKPIKIK
jgi:hypothetical protein